MSNRFTRGAVRRLHNNLISFVAAFVLVTMGSSGIMSLFLNQKAAAAGTVIVNPSALNSWTPGTTSGGTTTFIFDGTAPSGDGALRLTTTSDNNSRANISLPVSKNLSAVDTMSMYTKQVASAYPEINASYRISIDADGDLSTITDKATLIFEPYWQNGLGDAAPVITNTWQNWDVEIGKAWASISGGNTVPGLVNGGGGPPLYTITEILASNPNALVTTVAIGLGSYNPSSDILIDNFVFDDTTYNFEPVPLPACSSDDTTFDTFSTGSVNGQNGWSSTGPYDEEIVDNTYGYADFGCKSLRLSNAVTTGGFGDQTFSYSVTNEAGEADSTSNGMSGGTRQNHYEAQFDIASTSPTQQTGLALSVSPDRGDGSRMSYLRFEDNATGIGVFFVDVQGTDNPANFVETSLGTISRSTSHTIKLIIDYADGPSNDVVKVYIDGSLAHTGTTWENYYRYDSESVAEQSPRTTDSLIFRAAGTAAPANLGNGFLFDNVNIAATTILPPTPPIDPGIDGETGNSGSGSSGDNLLAPSVANPASFTRLLGITGGDDNTESSSTEPQNQQENKDVKSENAAISNASTDNNSSKKSWWWLLLLVLAALLYALYRRYQQNSAKDN